jgi:acyl-CoA reductase-like NAD-dependent aldehyde dehydrogenase
MLDDRAIGAIVEEVLRKLKSEGVEGAPEATASRGGGAFGTITDALGAAEKAHLDLMDVPLETRKKIIGAMRRTSIEHTEELSRLAVDETGLGRYEDKVNKNLLAATRTPGIEDLVPDAISGDHGLTVVERAPYGLITSITPSTNPSETVINNAIGMVAGGNSVVFNPHPGARRTTLRTIALLNSAIMSEGGPPNVLTCVEEPSIETAQASMKHEKVRLVVVTGGGAVVREAMKSGKKVIAAGPGNPPVVVDKTAELDLAARHIVNGASLDNNIVCICEKEVLAADPITDELKRKMHDHGAIEVKGRDLEKLAELVIKEDKGPSRHAVTKREYVGKDAGVFLSEIGVRSETGARLITCEVPVSHPFVWTELLMPILPIARVRDADEGILLAKQVEHGFGHTALMHSTDITKLSKMARFIGTTIFVKNGPSYAGLGFDGEGFTSFTIASPTGEGLTSARTFTRMRRCVLVDYFRII